MNEEEMIYQQESKRYMPNRLTIEGQLQMYERHPEKSERSATLWHAWRQNKGWLTRLLELTIASFPSYSRHNASHAEAVLYNIERILGENRIKELSATDCFAILHTVYVHDIGMAMLASDRENIIRSDEFTDMIDDLEDSADDDLRYAARQLKKRCYKKHPGENVDYEGAKYYERQRSLYAEKLDTYYAVIQMLAEYQRRKHGENAATKVKDWIKGKDMLQSEFVERFPELSLFYRLSSPLDSEMICIFPYFCPCEESAREIREILCQSMQEKLPVASSLYLSIARYFIKKSCGIPFSFSC